MNKPKGFVSEVFASYQGEGGWLGRRQIFLRLAGCSRDCAYCDTPRARAVRPASWTCHWPDPDLKTVAQTNPVDAKTLLLLLLQLHGKYGPFYSLAVTGGEPLEQADFVRLLLPAVRKRLPKLKIMLETNGLLAPGLKKVGRLVDFVSADIKLRSSGCGTSDWQGHEEFYAACRGLKGCVKVVVRPQTNLGEMLQAAQIARALVPSWDFILQPDTGVDWKAAWQLEKLDRLAQLALANHPGTRIIPQVHPWLGLK